MPLDSTTAKTPRGTPYMRTIASGAVSPADASALSVCVAPGGPFAGMPIVGVVESGAIISSEARHAFAGGHDIPLAVVVRSAPLRTMLGFVIRSSGARARTRLFGSEGEALAWLDQRDCSKAA